MGMGPSLKCEHSGEGPHHHLQPLFSWSNYFLHWKHSSLEYASIYYSKSSGCGTHMGELSLFQKYPRWIDQPDNL